MKLIVLSFAAVLTVASVLVPPFVRLTTGSALAAGGGAPDTHHEHEDDTLKPDVRVDVKTALSGNTIYVLAYRSFAKPVAASGGADSLDRVIFQAWLREDGVARVRVLDGTSNAWRSVTNEKWSVDGDVLCLTSGSFQIGLDRLCLDTLIYGQVFSAASPKADFIVKGNWRKGNALGL